MEWNAHSSQAPRALAAAGAVAALAAITGCGGRSTMSGASTVPGGSTPSAASSGPVTIKSYAYAPPSLTVASGTTVRFNNEDPTNHTATASDMSSFDTGTLAKGKTASVTLSKPGTFTYFCRFHPFMKGTIIVK